MPDEVRVLTRNETEQYIIKERFAKQYSSVDGGREARFRLAQGSMAGQLAHASDPVKNAELAGALNSLRAFSGEFAKYAENRAVYAGAKQIYDEYLASGAYDGSMLVPAEINGEKVRIKAENLADIAYVCEQRIRNAVKSRSAAAQQEFGAERVSGGVDFYSLSTPECADAVLGFSENIASGKAPEGAVQAAFAALNRQVAEKRAGREIPREAPLEKQPEKSAPEPAPQPDIPDIQEQLSRAMQRIAALEEQNRRLSEQNRKLERSEKEPAPEHTANSASSGIVRERISFQQLLDEAGIRRTLTTPESVSPEREKQKESPIL